jgi:hypothetical protein
MVRSAMAIWLPIFTDMVKDACSGKKVGEYIFAKIWEFQKKIFYSAIFCRILAAI